MKIEDKMPQPSNSNKSGKGKLKNFNDICTVFTEACSDLEEGIDDPVAGLIDQLRNTSQSVSSLNESDLTAIKVVNLLLPAVNAISSNMVGKHVRAQDAKVNKICSVIRMNTYDIDKQNQYSRRENIRINGLQETEGTDEFDIFRQLCEKMEIIVKKEDIVACHRVGDAKRKPRPLLVRVVSRDLKYKIFSNKKKLKDNPDLKKVFINEDLTQLRMKLLQYVKRIDTVKSAFTKEGKIVCIMKDGKKYTVENPDDLFNLGVDEVNFEELGLPAL